MKQENEPQEEPQRPSLRQDPPAVWLEVRSLLFQVKVSFWMWAGSLLFGFILLLVCALLFVFGFYRNGLAVFLLEAFVLLAQYLFRRREQAYRALLHQKQEALLPPNTEEPAMQPVPDPEPDPSSDHSEQEAAQAEGTTEK